jgi:hypothetical protein
MNPLDRICDSLERARSTLADMHEGEECLFHEPAGEGCLACEAQADVGEAVVVALRLRDAAVEGWVGASRGSRYLSHMRAFDDDVPALLIPLAPNPEKPDA